VARSDPGFALSGRFFPPGRRGVCGRSPQAAENFRFMELRADESSGWMGSLVTRRKLLTGVRFLTSTVAHREFRGQMRTKPDSCMARWRLSGRYVASGNSSPQTCQPSDRFNKSPLLRQPTKSIGPMD